MKSFLLIFVSLFLFGCDTPDGDGSAKNSPASTSDTPRQVITSFYPLAFITEQIAGDRIEVVNLSGNTDVHAYNPSAKDLARLNAADLVIFQGAGLEPWTEDFIPQLQQKGVNTLEVTHDIRLRKNEESEDNHEDDGDEYHEELEDDHEDEHEEDHHDHGEYDPHVWLDPILAQEIVEEITEALMTIDSKNSSFYKNSAKKLNNRFKKLHQDFRTKLKQCENQEVIVSHAAYGYLADRYGFVIHPIAGFSPQDQPSAKTLAQLKKEAQEGMTHILIEENNIRRFAETLARETGLKVLPINPLGRGTLDPEKDFFQIMQENLQSFRVALDCQS